MCKLLFILSAGIILFYLPGCASKKTDIAAKSPPEEWEKWAADEWAKEECADAETGIVAENGKIYDPLESVNRVFFTFNDKVYFWILKPIARVYAYFLPEDFRSSIRNAVRNILMPVRFSNNLLQGKFKNSGIELSRFVINSTLGIYGFADPAKNEFGLETKDEDFGQTLGLYGIGDGIYVCWPLFGPSNLRDTVGRVGDGFLNPLSYALPYGEKYGLAGQAGIRVNDTSLTLGIYEQFKESSFDPYIAVRDAYKQHRDSKIKDTSAFMNGVTYSGKGVCIPMDK